MSGRLAIAVLAVSWVRSATGQDQAPLRDLPSVAQAVDSQNPRADHAPAQSEAEQKIWANAKTYVDLPISEVMGTVPELKGLTAETSQEGLASLLGHLAQSCTDLLRHTPSLVSHEEQITQQRGISRISEEAFGPLTNAIRRERQEFGYLLLFRETAGGTELQEYRMDKNGRPIVSAKSQGGQTTVGFASEWLRLLPANQPELRFRYLGREKMDGHENVVIAFAQIPGHVRYPAQFSFDRTLITALFQGIVWVDASDFRIVRMREDLLAPRPDLHLSEMTTTIRFAEVQIPKAASMLWLPKEVTIAWEYKGIALEQRHLYSDFRLYGVHSKIVPQ
jgi:hypothetical protein